MLTSELLLNKAYRLALRHHANQKYGELNYVEGHLRKVAFFLATLTTPEKYDEYAVLAYLHDILEDTDCTRLEIKEEFGQDVLNDVLILTRRPEERYADYLVRCASKESTFFVKLADLYSSMTLYITDGNLPRANLYAIRIAVLVALRHREQ